eukprot:CAMPEP_0172830692 /NCGR_PEP_ID=MMETSP1075-20121228/22440_1 /TAXON_ID=2916 /ORGANISM="Ceratium fusus, Strain PA161109" /LENGTH=50 /DNA_ID=CAMNT_0013673027 /DNA_START=307 /DNA_END=456 /DNA_ORIENTATION=-
MPAVDASDGTVLDAAATLGADAEAEAAIITSTKFDFRSNQHRARQSICTP